MSTICTKTLNIHVLQGVTNRMPVAIERGLHASAMTGGHCFNGYFNKHGIAAIPLANTASVVVADCQT
jgi:riboflavin synthase alpha subunit